MRGRKNAVKACEALNEQDALRAAEVLKVPEGAKIPGELKAPEGTKIPGAHKAKKKTEVPCTGKARGGEKAPRVHRHKTGKSRRDKKHTLSAMIRAAADPKKRAVMSRVWHRRQKRVDHITALVRLVIRYLNARDRTTIYRHK